MPGIMSEGSHQWKNLESKTITVRLPGVERRGLTLLKQGELPAKKQVFGDECGARRQEQTYQLEHATFYKS